MGVPPEKGVMLRFSYYTVPILRTTIGTVIVTSSSLPYHAQTMTHTSPSDDSILILLLIVSGL
jgi:hypothetical protein